MTREHSHLCPVCRRAYNCTGNECVPYKGIVHPDCQGKAVDRADRAAMSARPIRGDNAPHNKESV